MLKYFNYFTEGINKVDSLTFAIIIPCSRWTRPGIVQDN